MYNDDRVCFNVTNREMSQLFLALLIRFKNKHNFYDLISASNRTIGNFMGNMKSVKRPSCSGCFRVR